MKIAHVRLKPYQVIDHELGQAIFCAKSFEPGMIWAFALSNGYSCQALTSDGKKPLGLSEI